MNHKELLKAWKAEDLYRFDLNTLIGKGLNEHTMDFLSIIGLPLSAAPFLSFANDDSDRELHSIHQMYGTDGFEHRYLLNIGSDGAGDPICIDLLNNCRIVILNHEKNFWPTFMNSSVAELFQFLTIYKAFGEEVIRTNGESAFLNADFTDSQFHELKEALREADEKALEADTLWAQELEALLGNREYYQKEN